MILVPAEVVRNIKNAVAENKLRDDGDSFEKKSPILFKRKGD